MAALYMSRISSFFSPFLSFSSINQNFHHHNVLHHADHSLPSWFNTPSPIYALFLHTLNPDYCTTSARTTSTSTPHSRYGQQQCRRTRSRKLSPAQASRKRPLTRSEEENAEKRERNDEQDKRERGGGRKVRLPVQDRQTKSKVQNR
ncbi:hypothetical protein QR685DRAFT_515076 [Neurospora intermedia]|uniref:Uncharacterized protein n=1 Tax=Neurospora intermedia TaxID=5142 RepID=A0ABR3DKH1_NEUIN